MIYLKRFKWFLVLLFVQVFILSHIHLWGYATPYLYIWMLIKLGRYVSHNELLLWGFSMGLIVDIFANTPGMNAAAATLVAFVRPVVLRWFTPRDQFDDFEPSARSMGVVSFTIYALYLVLLFQVVLSLLEYFSVFNLLSLCISIVSSSIFTLFLIAIIEFFRKE